MNMKALALMRLKISSGLQSLIQNELSASEAWTRLETTFQSQSEGRKGMLRGQLKDLKKRKDEDVLTYVSRAERLRTELRDACNEDMPEQAFIDYLLDGLGSAYSAFIRQIRYANEILELEALKPRLFAVEQRVNKDHNQPDDSARAYMSRSHAPKFRHKAAPRKLRNEQHRTRGACHHCHPGQSPNPRLFRTSSGLQQ